MSSALWRVSLAGLLLALARAAWVMPQVVSREAEKTRLAAVGAIAAEGQRLERQVGGIKAEISQKMASAGVAVEAVARLAETVTVAVADGSRGLAETNQRAQESLRDLQLTLQSARRTTDQVAETAELLGDCEGNPDCIANRVIPSLRAVEDVGASSVRIAGSLEVIAKSVEDVAPQAAKDAAGAVADARVAVNRVAHPLAAVGRALRWLGKKAVWVVTLGMAKP